MLAASRIQERLLRLGVVRRKGVEVLNSLFPA